MKKHITSIGRKLEKYLPEFIFQAIGKLYETAGFLLSDKKILKKNRDLKDIWKWKRAFLLATWPSIKLEDLSLLTWEDCFSVSNFFLHKDINTIQPKLHFFAPYHEPLVLENYVDWLRTSDSALPESTDIVLWHTTKEIVEKFSLFPKRKVYYLHLNHFPPLFNTINIEYPILAPQTGPIMILPVLLYMGYTEIYLLGCDHTVLRDYKKTVNNFYSKDKDMRVNATDSKSWPNIVDELASELNVFRQYEYYKTISVKIGTRVVNLSQDSWLDSFEYQTLDKVIWSK